MGDADTENFVFCKLAHCSCGLTVRMVETKSSVADPMYHPTAEADMSLCGDTGTHFSSLFTHRAVQKLYCFRSANFHPTCHNGTVQKHLQCKTCLTVRLQPAD